MQGSACAHTNGPLPGTFEMARTPGNALVVDHELPFTQCRAQRLTYIHFNSLQFIPIACNSGRNLHHKKLHEELSKNKR